MRAIPKKDFDLKWCAKRQVCNFHYKGTKTPVGCGVSDTVCGFLHNKKIAILSINYSRKYACLEIFSSGNQEVEEGICAYQKDVEKIFGEGLAGYSPKQIAQRLVKELQS